MRKNGGELWTPEALMDLESLNAKTRKYHEQEVIKTPPFSL